MNHFVVRLHLFIFLFILSSSCFSQELKFEQLNNLPWKEVFIDKGNVDWKLKWFLDGEKATIKNQADGMIFSAGPVERERCKSCSAVDKTVIHWRFKN